MGLRGYGDSEDFIADLNFTYHIHTSSYHAEVGIFAIQIRGILFGYKKLRVVLINAIAPTR